MERRIDLPSGGWCELRDPKSITNRERKPLVEHAEAESGEDASLVAKLGFADRLVSLMVASWGYDFPIPKERPESLDDMPAIDLDTLRLAVQKPENMPFLNMGDWRDPKASPGDSKASSTEFSTTTSDAATISLTSESIA